MINVLALEMEKLQLPGKDIEDVSDLHILNND